MWRIDHMELERYLNEIVECDAFELHKSELNNGKWDYYIPYMMNDALECYLILKNGRMTGVYDAENKEEISVELLDTDQGPAAFFRQGESSVFTIWYEESCCEQKCYRYDQIGHFWVQGEEHWRRLAYIIGMIYDKFSYMGETVCTEKEQDLMLLMEFAPFRYFTPIHESLDAYYEDSGDGFACMKALAEEADDKEFLRLMKLYEVSPFKAQMVRQMIKAMQNPKRNKLYQLIFQKVEEASSVYPERMYQDGLHEVIKQTRTEVTEKLCSKGFEGTYPLFYKENLQVLVMEEHPFTITELEYENYGFKIQYMVSQTAEPNPDHLLNAGFFEGKGNRGWIAKNMDEIL